MKPNTFILDVDIKQNNYINEPVIKQNDSVVFIINLTDDGAPMDLTGVTTFTIATERGDGISVIATGTKTGDSQVTFNLPRESTTRIGRAKHTVQLYSADERVSSFNFPMVVEKDPSASLIVSGGDKTLIEIVLGEGPAVIQSAKDATVAATTATGKANTAASNADSKASAANTATSAANAATSKANASASAADLAAGKVDTAISNTNASASAADIATGKASTAAINADTKAGLAQTAADNANAESANLSSMKEASTTATAAATNAALSANTASDKANASSLVADTSAANADEEANNAQTQAAHAKTQGDYAKTQGDYAKLQGGHAKAEGDKAALETADLTGMKTAVTTATSDAITAAELANTEATGLELLKSDVVTATTNATGASTEATTQATYAKEQGDYAKAQGDAVQGVFDAGLVASVNGKTGAVVITAADVGADTPSNVDAKVTASEQAAKDYADTQITAIPKPDLTPYATKTALTAEENARVLQGNKKIHEGEVHGMRLVEGAFEIFDGTEWVELKGGGGAGIPLGNVENLAATAEVGNKITVVWKDPADVILDGITLAKWGGTKLVRKEGTYPTNEKDGTVLVDSKVRDAHATTGYTDSALTAGTTYYYALFPYTDGGLTTIDVANRVTATAFEKYTKAAPTKPVASKLQQNKATITSDVGSVVSLDKVDWFASPHEFTGLVDGQSYTPYAKVEATPTHFESPVATGSVFVAVNKLPKAKPTVPVISAMKYDRATVTSEAGTVVSINGTNWFPTPHEFTGLTAETGYTAYAKFEESSTHLESPMSQTSFTTPSAVKIYGVAIDTTNSNPETAVTYNEAAAGFTSEAGFANVYPFNEIKPVMFKNGLEVYDIDPNDFGKKVSGGAIGASGADGDVMIRFPKLWWYMKRIGTVQFVAFATGKATADYKCLAHTKNGVEKDYSYIGAYLGFEEAGKLRSVSGKTPTATKTIGQFRTLAQANGTGYQQISYFQILMMQVLYLVRYKNRDSQTAIGRGYVDGNSSATTTGGADKKGMTFGETTGKQQMKLFGVEDFWGNLLYFVDGIYSDASWNILLGDNNFNDTGAGYTNHGKGASSNLSGYITDIQGGTETGFITKSGGGSETTHYADNGYLISGRLAAFGGYWTYAGNAGAFYLLVHLSGSSSNANYGGRCCFV